MKRAAAVLFLLLGFAMTRAFASGSDEGLGGKIAIWHEYMVGTGGSVPQLWTFGDGGEYAFFRDDYGHEVSVSIDLFNDRTSYTGQKLLMPVLFNYRWYVSEHKKGLFFDAGIGEAIPFGLDHGSGSFAWQGSAGYFVSKNFIIRLRYIGRRNQTVTANGSSFTTNGAFIGATADYKLW